MLHLLAQLQKKLQLDLKTNITQNYQNIKLYGSLTMKDLRRHIHPDRWRGRVVEMGREARRCDVVWRGSGSGGMGGPTFMYGG